MPKLLVVHGVSSVEYANHIVDEFSYVPLTTDIAEELLQKQCFEAMRAGQNIIVSDTLCRHWEMEPYSQMAQLMGYEVKIISLTREETLARCAKVAV